MKSDSYRLWRIDPLLKCRAYPRVICTAMQDAGGNISYIENMLHVEITPLSRPLDSIGEMDAWFQDNIKCHFPDKNGYVQRVAAAFVQAKADSISVQALSYTDRDIYSFSNVDIFFAVMDGMHSAFAPETRLLADLFVYNVADKDRLDEILSAHWFNGVDICNYANSMSMGDMKAISRKAHKHNMIVKAHVGEFGGADDVMRYAEELELDQIQHGIAAARSPQIMNWLAEHKVQLNVCPTSNLLLGNTESYETHQIRILYDYGIPVGVQCHSFSRIPELVQCKTHDCQRIEPNP